MAISVIKLNEKLLNDHETITSVLIAAGFTNITQNIGRSELRFSHDIDSNPTSTVLYIDSLRYYCFSLSKSGNLYTLLMDKLQMNFPSVLKWVSKVIGFESFENVNQKKRLPFGGFYKELIQYRETPPELNLTKYNEDILKPYSHKLNTLFFKDGINYQTQEYFNLGYDCITNRITIPEYDVNGNLVGIMGRLNKETKDIEDYEMRWFPIIPCSRGHILYGYHQNYKDILEKDILFIGESEKFVMQLHSMGIKTALGLGTCNISKVQAQYIKELKVKRIVLCFDEGLDEEQSKEMCKKIVSNNLVYKNKVGYIYDKNNILLPKNSKSSPSDFGYNIFKKLFQNHIIWFN